MIVDVDIGLKRPPTFTLTIKDILLVVMGELDIGPRPATITPEEEIVVVMVQDVELGMKK